MCRILNHISLFFFQNYAMWSHKMSCLLHFHSHTILLLFFFSSLFLLCVHCFVGHYEFSVIKCKTNNGFLFLFRLLSATATFKIFVFILKFEKKTYKWSELKSLKRFHLIFANKRWNERQTKWQKELVTCNFQWKIEIIIRSGC